jgi:hypothetical protein
MKQEIGIQPAFEIFNGLLVRMLPFALPDETMQGLDAPMWFGVFGETHLI